MAQLCYRRQDRDRVVNRLGLRPAIQAAAGWFYRYLEPSGIVRGQVIYGDTRKPAAGVHVHPAPTIYATITDSQGRYSMEQLDAGKYTLYAEPPEGADYLSSVADVEIVVACLSGSSMSL